MEFRKEDLMKALTKQKAQLDAEREEHTRTRRLFELEVLRIDTELKTAKEAAAQCAELAVRLEELGQERERLRERLEQEEGGRKQTEAVALQERAEFEKERQNANSDRLRNQRALETLQSELHQLTSINETNERELDHLRNALVAETGRGKASDIHYSLEVQTALHRAESSETKVAELEAALESKNLELQVSEQEIVQLKGQADAFLDQAMKLKTELSLQMSRNDAKVNDLMQENETLKTNLSILKQDDAETRKSEAALLEDQLESSRREIQILNQKLKDVLMMDSETESAKREAQELKTQLEELKKELNEMQRRQNDSKGEKQELIEEVAKLSPLEGQLEIAIREVERLNELAQRRQDQHEADSQVEHHFKAEMHRLVGEKAEMQRLLHEYETNALASEQARSLLEAQLKEVKLGQNSSPVHQHHINAEVPQGTEDLVTANRRLQSEIDSLSNWLQDERDLKQKLETKIEEALRAYRKIEDESKSLRHDLMSSSARFDVMLSGEPGPWVQYANDDDMPVPRHVTLESPVIQTILQAWTQDPKNLQFFNKWCSHILKGQDVGPSARFQKGVELSKCTPNVKDGLISMLVPMLRARGDIEVSIFTRERLQVYHDVRLRVTKVANGQQSGPVPTN